MPPVLDTSSAPNYRIIISADREAAQCLIRGLDSSYGAEVRLRIKSLSMQEILTAPRSPWQSPYTERLIGSIRATRS